MLELKPVGIHEHSTISDGNYTLDELHSFAEKNLDFLIVTDHDRFNYSSGIWAAEVSARVNCLFTNCNIHLLSYIPIVEPLIDGTEDEKLLRQKRIFAQKEKIYEIENVLSKLCLNDLERITRHWLNEITLNSNGDMTFSDAQITRVAKEYHIIKNKNKRVEDNYNYNAILHMLKKEYNTPTENAKKLISIPNSTGTTHLQAQNLIKMVNEAGGYVMIAHPLLFTKKVLRKIKSRPKYFLQNNIEILEKLITNGQLYGIAGFETGYPAISYINPMSENVITTRNYSNKEFNALLHLSKKLKLHISISDDHHGRNVIGDRLEDVGYLHNQPIIYFDFLKLINPKMAEERYNYLVNNEYMKAGSKFYVAPDIAYQKEFNKGITNEQTNTILT
ncbi:MAG: hypothetical protein WCX32_02590 [Clostridia bacterium]|jgi:hypothetical protein|nr:hypothetical protein [Clostridia bacterium]